MMAWYGTINVAGISEALGVHKKTVLRWRREGSAPKWAKLLGRALFEGDVSVIHGAWHGWVINASGELCSPENRTVTPGVILSWQFHTQRIRALERELASAKKTLERFRQGRPVVFTGRIRASIDDDGELVVVLESGAPQQLLAEA